MKTKFNRRDFLKFSTAVAAASALAACAPNDENSTAVPFESSQENPVINPEAQTPLPAVPLAILALNRLTFGIRPGDVDSFNALGTSDDERLNAFVSQQLNPDSIDDSEFESRYNSAGFETLHKTHEQLYSDHIANNAYNSNDEAYWDWFSKPAYELTDATFLRAIYSKKQIIDRKSTRLNSSHSQISYAVFCLKKK